MKNLVKFDLLGMNFLTGQSLVGNVATILLIGKVLIGGVLGPVHIHILMESVFGMLNIQMHIVNDLN